MDSTDHLIAGAANVELPLALEHQNVVLTHSGWGDGTYPVLAARDGDGNLVELSIDLYVAIVDEEEAEDVEPVIDPSPPARASWWRRGRKS